MNKTFLCLFLALLLLSCTKKTESCDDGDRKCFQGLMDKHMIRTMSYWRKFYDNPLNERVFVAPKEVVEYIDLDNRKNGYPNKPLIPKVSKKFIKEIKEAIDEIPDSVKNLLKTKFVAVFLVNDLGGTGFTDYILNEKGDPVAGFVVLDAQVLQKRNANEWATWKESTPFKSDPAFSIEATIEPKGTNTRKYAIQYILLHELGHVITAKEFFHPHWGMRPSSLGNIEKYEFFNQSWRVDKKKNKFISRFDANVSPNRDKVVYYFGPKLNGNQMPQVYTHLEGTDFPTLYAATHPSDDWAESFVTYVHSVLMKKPFSIKIKKDGKVIKDFKLCWGTPRCAKKEAILAKLLGTK